MTERASTESSRQVAFAGIGYVNCQKPGGAGCNLYCGSCEKVHKAEPEIEPPHQSMIEIGEEAFRSLPKEERSQIFNGDLNDVGGRSTDVSQLAWSIEAEIKDFFPMNGIPPEIISEIGLLHDACREVEDHFGTIVLLLARIVEGRRPPKVPVVVSWPDRLPERQPNTATRE